MQKVEMFFDHTCPYCLKGHGYLMELLPKYPSVEIIWKPIEAHPKVEEPEHLPYEDMAVQGALFIKDAGGDELKYHENVYHAYFTEKQAPDDIAVLVKCAGESCINTDSFIEALQNEDYKDALQQANDYAYETRSVWAVPTFVCNDTKEGTELRLDSIAGIGITKTQLDEFLATVSI